MKTIKNRITAAALAALLLAFLTSCAPADRLRSYFTDSGSEAPATAAPEAAGDVSNTIVIGMYGFDTFNPLMTNSQTVKEAMEFVYEPLFTLNELVQPEPVLASDYGMSADGRTIVINLRNDAQWHDGTGFNAYDAAYTIRMIKEGKTAYTNDLKSVSDWSVTGDYQITVSFDHPVPNAASLFTFPVVQYGTVMDGSSGYTPIGTGPFAYSGKISTDRYMLNAFDYYYGGKAKIDGVYIDTCPDAEHYIYMYSAGAFDAATSATVDLKSYTPKGGVYLNEFTGSRMTFLGINCQKPELSGVNTRKAIADMTDKDDIISSVMFSRADRADVPVNPKFWLGSGAAADDGVSADAHLRIDGWTNPDGSGYVRDYAGQRQTLTLELLTDGDNADKKAIADKIAERMKVYGINVTVTALPYAQYTARVDARQYDLFIGEIELSPAQDISEILGAGNLFNYSGDAINALASQIGMTSDTETLKTLYAEFASVFGEEMPFVPLFYAKEYMMSSPRIGDLRCPGISGFYRLPGGWRIQ
ncbi:MAG TPA: ABC transporter substrate-binding protein [Candidatus Ornithomonoglobus intestinigallinarum]|uniref:ABC transporter substrate-binding protein n=1 Tax=Candidatus Ornithomonoglobus intestinigallinarum TaxID=2840894 RepID=A0A9D1H5V5_9FIRM|nr:ABC transporter substrate-binding protein [Candidatus Ornithomonoglobus intestinigallinarum]